MARNRLTLLEIVQRALDAMNHDNVNTIDATAESTQIAKEAKHVYYEFMDRDDWPHLLVTQPLEAVSDTARPNYLKIPQDVVRIDKVRYEITKSGDSNRTFDTIDYLEPNEFIEYVLKRNSSDTNTTVITTFGGIPLFIRNDQRPYYWTTFDDDYLVFDSYDSDVDTTMQASKSIVHSKVIPAWTHSDTFVPDMPDQMFSTFVAEVTAAAFNYWKQGTSPRDEVRAARGISRLRKDAEKHNEHEQKVDYGRRRYHGIQSSADGVRGSIRAAQFPS